MKQLAWKLVDIITYLQDNYNFIDNLHWLDNRKIDLIFYADNQWHNRNLFTPPKEH